MSDDTTPKTATGTINGVKIAWDDSEMQSHYANIGTATANREEFFLLFGTHQHWRGTMDEQKEVDVKLANRIVMSPFAAKRLAVILTQSIRAYEEQFGKIEA
ncbi:DUF3467 domain-containing protein [Pseudooceanicola marinus]|uniref:DUF3467 domain-containing protein n=1 Tax=Pseudooceanicola marinus TaxID=396013 RepID=UPI001C95A634|nr:DUF3467 domain-containing protein [Pseudooceanicola marinus]MBY5973751.1 DUF3467 domain-containing protein [Ferrimonas balearica]MCA1337513.1 DUF3467 domain-containing protein [Pseudooceanicola marinus]